MKGSGSKSHCDRRSVSQYILVSSPIWDFWPVFFFKVSVLSFFGAPSLTRGRVCHWSLQQSVIIYNYLHLNLKMYKVLNIYKNNKIYTIYTGLVQSRLCAADYALLTSNLVYHGSLRRLNSRTHDRRQVWASYIFCVGQGSGCTDPCTLHLGRKPL
jgi:hypothetical protein